MKKIVLITIEDHTYYTSAKSEFEIHPFFFFFGSKTHCVCWYLVLPLESPPLHGLCCSFLLHAFQMSYQTVGCIVYYHDWIKINVIEKLLYCLVYNCVICGSVTITTIVSQEYKIVL